MVHICARASEVDLRSGSEIRSHFSRPITRCSSRFNKLNRNWNSFWILPNTHCSALSSEQGRLRKYVSLWKGRIYYENVEACASIKMLFSSSFLTIFSLFFSVLPMYIHIKTVRNALSAERVYDIHCITYGSRPSALVTWWLGTTQLLDHSSQVRNHPYVT